MWSETKKKNPMSWLFFVVKNFPPLPWSNQTSSFPRPLSFLPEDLVKVRWPPAQHAHECSVRALKSIHGVHWPGFRAALTALWVGSCLKRAGGAGVSAGLPLRPWLRISPLLFSILRRAVENGEVQSEAHGSLVLLSFPVCTSRPC